MCKRIIFPAKEAAGFWPSLKSRPTLDFRLAATWRLHSFTVYRLLPKTKAPTLHPGDKNILPE
jgi:hypothetical protein